MFQIIFVYRNPRDVCCSLLNHFRMAENYAGTQESITNMFLQDTGPYYAPFFVTLLSYWKRRHQDNFFVVSYEEMQQDLPKVIKDVAKFLGKSISDADIPKLTDHLSLDSMKKNPMTNFEKEISVSFSFYD